jgi:hypothetical protein
MVTAYLCLALCALVPAFAFHPLRLLGGRLARCLRRRSRVGGPGRGRHPPGGGLGEGGEWGWEISGAGIDLGQPMVVVVEVRSRGR